jgi:hypothetical protein
MYSLTEIEYVNGRRTTIKRRSIKKKKKKHLFEYLTINYLTFGQRKCVP